MLPFNSQRTQFPIDSSLSSLYPYLFGPLTQGFNQLLPNTRQMNTVDSFYASILLQNTQRLLDNALFYQNQKEMCRSNQLWQDLATSLTDSKFKGLLKRDGSKVSESQLQHHLDPSTTENRGMEAVTASLNQNLESSAMKKPKQISFTKRQKRPKSSKIESHGGSNSNNIHHTICKIEAEEDGYKRIKTNDQESRNQIGLQPQNCDPFLKALDPNDCAFDSNDESDTENNEWWLSGGHDCISNSTQEQLQQKEESNQKTFISTEYVPDTKSRECQMIDEKVKIEFNCHQLLENELEDLNSSFSSDDWPSLSEEAEFQILQQDQL